MRVLSVALLAWCTFALLRLVVVTRTDAWSKTTRNASGIRAAAISSLSGFLSLASLMLAVSSTIALVVIVIVNASGGTTLQEARHALGRIEEFSAFLGSLDAAMGIAFTVALITALAYQAYRSGSKRFADALNKHIAKELSLLKEKDLKELPPTEDMQKLAAMIKALQNQIAGLDEQDAAYRQLNAKLNLLVQQYHTMDLLRRINTNLANPKPMELSGFGRILLFFSSVGMLRSLKGFSRITTIVGLLLLLPSTLTIATPEILQAAESRVLALNETIERLELQVVRDRVDREYEAMLKKNAPRALSSEDEQAIDEIASIFESEVVHARFLKGINTLRASSDAAALQARNQILEASGSHPTVGSQSVRKSTLRPLEQRVLALNAVATGSRSPVTSFGERLRSDLRETVSQFDQTVWGDMRNRVGDYVRSFQETPNPRDVRAMILSDALGHLIGDLNADGPVEKLLQMGASGLTGEMVEAAYRTESRRLVIVLSQSTDIMQALRDLSSVPHSMSSEALEQVRFSVRNIPTPESIAVLPSSVAVSPPPGISDVAAARAVHSIARTRESVSANTADALLMYGDLFPGQPSEPVSSIHGKLMGRLAPSLFRANSSASYARARSYTRLRGYSRIGGVILGRDPKPSTSLRAGKLKWRVTDRDVFIWILDAEGSRRQLGRYDPAIVHNALVYAADGRVTTVTMVTAEPLSDLRILLHPALVDTGLGCSAIRLDQFVAMATGGNQLLREHSEKAVANVFRQHKAYWRAWAVRLRELYSLPSYRNRYKELGLPQSLVEQANQIVDPKEGVALDLPIIDLGFLSSKPEFYDKRLVNALSLCSMFDSDRDFDKCILASVTADAYGSDLTASWAAPYPSIVSWSGVREQPWAIDDGLNFMKSDEPLGPFRFIVQIVFSSPPYFVGEGAWYAESNPARDLFDDESPYELTLLGDALMDEIGLLNEPGTEMAIVLSRMAEFTYLQRLFRAILDGRIILTEMGLADLTELANQTVQSVNRTETLRWLPKPMPYEKLKKEAESRNATQEEVTDFINEFVELRESLRLDLQQRLYTKLEDFGCPAPGN